jgi:hypothetical protein
MPVKDKNINNTIKTIKLKTNLNRYIEVPFTMIKGSIRRGIIDDFIYIENSNVVCDHITINNNLDGESYEDPCEEKSREPYEEPCREQSKIVKSTIDNLPIVVGSASKAIKILQNRQK